MHHIQDPKQDPQLDPKQDLVIIKRDLIMLEEPPQHQGRGEK